MHSPSACDGGGTGADPQTIPSTGQRGEAELSLTPCLLKEKAVLSLCRHKPDEVTGRAVFCRILVHAQLFWECQ